MSEIERKLTTFKRRVRWLHVWKFVAIGAAIGGALSLAMAVIDFFRLVYFEWPVLILPVIAGILVGALFGWYRKVSLQQLADSVDRRASLQNRVGTATETPSNFEEELKSDALRHLSSVKPAAVFPVRVTKWHAGALSTWVLAASLFLLGNTPLLLSESEKANREELERIGQTVERVAKPILERKPEEVSKEAKELAKKFEELSKELKKGRMPKEEAMQKANDLAKEAEKFAQDKFDESDKSLETAQKALSKMATEKALEESGLKMEDLKNLDQAEIDRGAGLSDEQRKQETENLQSQIDSLMKKLSENKGDDGKPLTREESDFLKAELESKNKQLKSLKLSEKVKDMLERLKARPEYKELMELMKKLQKKNQEGKNGQMESPELSEKEIQELMKKLDELADKLKDDKELQKFLEDAIEALKKAGECSGGG